MSRSIEACVLCGNEFGERVMAIVEWIEPIGKEQWSHVPRCVDRGACRQRVEHVIREPWPVADGTPAPVRSAPPEPEPVAPPAPDAEEISWLR